VWLALPCAVVAQGTDYWVAVSIRRCLHVR